MPLLLDTSTFLWVAIDSPRLSATARELFASEDNESFLSCVSCWEIAVKYGLGRLPLPEPPDRYIPRLREEHGIEPLSLDEESALHVTRLPALHRDPFDRMLVCQAIVRGLVLLTPDEAISQYPVRSKW